MSVEKAQIELRPLGAHSCTDLGFALARHWYWSLLTLYLIIFFPVLIIAAVVIYFEPEQASVVQLVLWWLKPLGELGLLYWCSQSLFGTKPGFSSTFFSTYKSLPRLLLNYLSVFRLSPTRGLSMCVVFLEKTKFGKGRKRLDVLSGSGSALTWVLVVGAHVEVTLAVGIYLMLIYLIPFDSPLTESFDRDNGAIAWFEALDNNFYLLCGFAAEVIFAPFFVCASFVHYINRRSRLEAWDIQHRFNALKNRVQNEKSNGLAKKSASAITCLLACLLVFTLSPQKSLAASTADDAAVVINDILQQERFGHYSESGRIQAREVEPEQEGQATEYDFSLLESAYNLFASEGFNSAFYLIVIGLFGYIVVRTAIRFWPATAGLLNVLALPKRATSLRPEQTLSVAPASFVEARQLMLRGDTRAALACLLRSVITAAREQDGLEIRHSFTESECQQIIDSNLNSASKTSFAALLALWRKQAYEGRDVSPLYADQVIKACESAFAERQS